MIHNLSRRRVLAATLATAGANAAWPLNAKDERTIPIGQSAPLTGPLADAFKGVLAGEIKVPTEQELTFYARHGELFAKACAAITLVSILLLFGVRRWKRV